MTMQAGQRIFTEQGKRIWVAGGIDLNPATKRVKKHFYIDAPKAELTPKEARKVRDGLTSLLKRKDWKWESE